MKTTLIILGLTISYFSIFSQQTGTFKDPRDGKIYKTVKIGTQTWFAENLAYEAGEGTYLYKNDTINKAKYGLLYNLETAQMACPNGWHLSSDADWDTLVTFLGGVKKAGGQLKTKENWSNPNTEASNKSGFNGMPAGNLDIGGSPFANLGTAAHFWTSTKTDNETAWKRSLYFEYAGVGHDQKDHEFGFSVRCIKFSGETGVFKDPRDRKVYNTVKIGTQTWFAENLAFKTDSGSWCYNDSNKYCEKFGRLYNWQTSITICPTGWHLPSDAEWTRLTNYLGGQYMAGGKMKATTDWNSPNTGATNESGFSALASGKRSYRGGKFSNVGETGGWWSSTASAEYAINAWGCYLGNEDARADINDNDGKEAGYSVRCIRD